MKCSTREEMRSRHGSPRDFADAVNRAYADGYLGQEYRVAHEAIDKYGREFCAAPSLADG